MSWAAWCRRAPSPGTAGGLCTPTSQGVSEPSSPATLVHTHLQPNQCLATDTSRPFPPFFFSLKKLIPLRIVQPQPPRAPRKEEKRLNSAEPQRSIFALSWKKTSTRTQKSSRGKETLPFDSTLSPSRSSRLSPVPTAQQSTTISLISSAWLPGFCVPPPVCALRGSPCSALLSAVSGGLSRSAVSVQGASPSGFGRLRQSIRRSGASRKQQANISEVRGQRLADSNPIKTPAWKRAGAVSESSCTERFLTETEKQGLDSPRRK